MKESSVKMSYGERKTLAHYEKRLMRKARDNNCHRPVQDYLLPMINGRKQVDILDVGSGPFSKVGTICEGTVVNITACDILADEYKKMVEKAGIDLVTPVVKEDMENLSYMDNSFDIVQCINALDHTVNPGKALIEMYRVCRKGGWIYLYHYMNSGERRHYTGMHWWNITESGKFWNERLESFTVTEILPLLAEFQIELENNVIVMRLRK